MKRLKWILASVVALIVLALVVVYFNLSSIVRRTVETQANASLNVPTRVGGASISLFGGKLGLDDIQVGSPPGFSAPKMFSLDGVKVGVSYGDLRKEPITVDSIIIDKPSLVIEQAGGKFNFKVLMDQQSKEPSSGETMKLIINDLAVNNAEVSLRPGIPGLRDEIKVPIPSFTLKGIGTADGAKNGAAVKEVVMLLVTTMASKASESDKLPPEIQLLLKGDLESVARDMAAKYGDKVIGEITKGLPKEVGGAVGDVLNAARDGKDPAKAVEDELKGLLGDKKRPTTKPK